MKSTVSRGEILKLFCFLLLFGWGFLVVFPPSGDTYVVQPRYDNKETFPYSTPYLIKNTICVIHVLVRPPYKACKIVFLIKSRVVRKSCQREMEGNWCYMIFFIFGGN